MYLDVNKTAKSLMCAGNLQISRLIGFIRKI